MRIYAQTHTYALNNVSIYENIFVSMYIYIYIYICKPICTSRMLVKVS